MVGLGAQRPVGAGGAILLVMRSVYVETSVASYYAETRETVEAMAWRQATRRWWAKAPGKYRLVTSEYVFAELQRAPEPKRSEALRILEPVELLDPRPETDDVIAYYMEHKLMPQDATGDAAHLAMASLARVDFLVTWNLRHLANVHKLHHAEVLNARLKLPTPQMVTPYSLLEENIDE